jgi:hypothetical protein
MFPEWFRIRSLDMNKNLLFPEKRSNTPFIKTNLLYTNIIRKLCRQQRLYVKKNKVSETLQALVLLLVFNISESRKLSILKKSPIDS